VQLFFGGFQGLYKKSARIHEQDLKIAAAIFVMPRGVNLKKTMQLYFDALQPTFRLADAWVQSAQQYFARIYTRMLTNTILEDDDGMLQMAVLPVVAWHGAALVRKVVSSSGTSIVALLFGWDFPHLPSPRNSAILFLFLPGLDQNLVEEKSCGGGGYV
jgi:hypothetical protein